MKNKIGMLVSIVAIALLVSNVLGCHYAFKSFDPGESLISSNANVVIEPGMEITFSSYMA